MNRFFILDCVYDKFSQNFEKDDSEIYNKICSTEQKLLSLIDDENKDLIKQFKRGIMNDMELMEFDHLRACLNMGIKLGFEMKNSIDEFEEDI